MFDFDTFSKLLALNVGVTQPDNERAFELMSAIVPLKILKYPSGREHNGWVIPHAWRVHKALIKKEGVTLFDGSVHPMAVAGYSTGFEGVISKKELDDHVFFNREYPDAFVFHCVYNYRPWERRWGFCVPYGQYRTWGEGQYEIELVTELKPSEMLVGECRLPGESSDTIVFNAHTCHPTQANDDMAGVMVVLELFRWLAERPRRYSYCAVLAPEHIGTVFYLAGLTQEELRRFKLGCFVEMVGSETPLALQRSFSGDSIIDAAAEHVLKAIQPELKVGPFRSIVGNDETVWEAPGIEIPMISISRWPYPQYHTSCDSLDIMSETRLEEALGALKRMIEALENDATMHRRFTGLVALSNPKYQLYWERPDPVANKQLSEGAIRFGELQDYLPRYFDGRHTILNVACRFGVPFSELRRYVMAFEEKQLIDLRPVSSLDLYGGR
jgi:aminopeptidase-like protein